MRPFDEILTPLEAQASSLEAEIAKFGVAEREQTRIKPRVSAPEERQVRMIRTDIRNKQHQLRRFQNILNIVREHPRHEEELKTWHYSVRTDGKSYCLHREISESDKRVEVDRVVNSLSPYGRTLEKLTQAMSKRLQLSSFIETIATYASPSHERNTIIDALNHMSDHERLLRNVINSQKLQSDYAQKIIKLKKDLDRLRSSLTELTHHEEEPIPVFDPDHFLTAPHQENRERLRDQLAPIQTQLAFVTGASRANSAQLEIRKDRHNIEQRMFYSLWLGDSPVLLYDNGFVSYLHCTRQVDPLEIVRVSTAAAIRSTYSNAGKLSRNKKIRLSKELLGLEDGDFMTTEAYKIVDLNHRVAADIFDRVKHGIEIFPNKGKNPLEYRPTPAKREEKEPTFRTWGQVYLRDKQPDTIQEGQVLGSGGAYKAFRFVREEEEEEVVLVEFDQEDHATYAFTGQGFDALRVNWSREEILKLQPIGFLGRVIHLPNKQADWKASIDTYLK